MELPDLALIKILNFWSLHDQLTIGRLVCKQWKALIETDILANSRKELVLFSRMPPRPSVWRHNQQTVCLDDSIVVQSEMIADDPRLHQRLHELFPNLKSLYISTYYIDLRGFNLSKIVQPFPNLEHLEIYNLHYEYYPQDIGHLGIDLSHANLRSLHLGYKDRIVNLNCPSLTALSVYDSFHLDEKFNSFKNSLRFLEVRSFSHAPDQVLPNLEVLGFSDHLQIDVFSFEKLREIHRYHRFRKIGREGDEHQENLDRIRESLLERRMILERNLEVYDVGVRCKPGYDRFENPHEVRLFSGFGFSTEELHQILSNSNEFEMVKGKFHLDHVALGGDQKRTGNDLVEHLARSIRHLVIPDYEWAIIHFALLNSPQSITLSLKSYAYSYPRELKAKPLFQYVEWLQLFPMSQSLLDELPNLLPSLVELKSVYGDRFEARTLNFSFISRFGALKRLAVENDWLSIDLLSKIFTNCKFIDYLNIFKEQSGASISSCPIGNGQYKVSFRGSPKSEKIVVQSKTELLNYFNENRLIKKNFFDNYFNRNYYLINGDSDKSINQQIHANYHLTPEDYFFERFH